MTVEELIKELRKLPGKGIVLVQRVSIDDDSVEYVPPRIVAVVPKMWEKPDTPEFVL